MALERAYPAEYKAYAHHWLILHGRYVCKARKPECPDCVVADLCHYKAKTGPAELIAARAAAAEPEALIEPARATPPRGRRRRREARNQPTTRARAPTSGISLAGFAGRLRLDIAGDLAAAFDLDLAVADRPRDPAGGLDQQPLADDEIALEAAAHLGVLDRGGALEQAALGDVDIAAIGQVGLDAALDEQLVAGIDLARQRNFAADAEPAHFAVGFGLIGQSEGGAAANRPDETGRLAAPDRAFAAASPAA